VRAGCEWVAAGIVVVRHCVWVKGRDVA
jgi:hypothetical protein